MYYQMSKLRKTSQLLANVCLLSPGSWLVFVVLADAHMLSTETFPPSSASLEALPKIFAETAAFPCLSFENILFLPFPTLPRLHLSYPEHPRSCCLVLLPGVPSSPPSEAHSANSFHAASPSTNVVSPLLALPAPSLLQNLFSSLQRSPIKPPLSAALRFTCWIILTHTTLYPR